MGKRTKVKKKKPEFVQLCMFELVHHGTRQPYFYQVEGTPMVEQSYLYHLPYVPYSMLRSNVV